MKSVNLRIEFQKVKFDLLTEIKKLKIMVQIGGKNVYTSYQQKVKNNIVNFYGQSFDIQLSTLPLEFKLVQITQDQQEKIIATFRQKIDQISQTKKQYNTDQHRNITFYWSSKVIDQSQTDDEDLRCTNLSMSEQVKHKIFSEQMIDRKLKRLYTYLPAIDSIQIDDRSISSEFTGSGKE